MANLPHYPLTTPSTTATPNADLPVEDFPSLRRIVTTDLVGPSPTNSPAQSFEKRDEYLRNLIAQLFDVANVLDAWFIRRDGSVQQDSLQGMQGTLLMNNHPVSGLPAASQPTEAIRKTEFDALALRVTNLETAFAAATTFKTGMIIEFPSSNAMGSGWLECLGQILNIVDYPALGAELGNTWGGNGTSTFGIPEKRGRTTIGRGVGSGLSNRTLAQLIGEETHDLITNEIPPHKHNVRGSTDDNGDPGQNAITDPGSFWGFMDTENAGGGQAHNNMQPSVVSRFWIKT